MKAKKEIEKILLIFSMMVIVVLTGCAVTGKRAEFHSLPSTSIDGDLAWNIVIESARQYYPQIELEDKKAGIIKSTVQTTDTCWAGLAFGGFVPCKTERFVARVWSLAPFKADIAVQRHKATTMSNYRTWIEDGNNSEREKVIYENIAEKLSSR